MNSEEVNHQLATKIHKMVKLKTEIQNHQRMCKQLRQDLQSQEEQVKSLMIDYNVGECSTANVSVKLTQSRRQPTATFKLILPLIQKIFRPSEQTMETFLQAVSEYKQDNVVETTRVVCRVKKEKTSQPRKTKTPPAVVAPSPQVRQYDDSSDTNSQSLAATLLSF